MSSFWEILVQLMCQATQVPAAGDIFLLESRWRGSVQRNGVWCTLPCTNHYMMLECFKINMKVHASCISYRVEAKSITGLHKRWVPCPRAVLHRGAGNTGLNPRLQLKWKIQKNDASRRKSGAKQRFCKPFWRLPAKCSQITDNEESCQCILFPD